MKKLLVLALTLGCLAGPVWADSASHRKAVEELFQTLEMRATVVHMAQLLTDQFCSMDPQMQTYRDEIAAYVWKNLGWDALKEDLTRMYMEAFTEAEVKELNTFYRSAAGRKAIKKIPELATAAAELGQQRFDANLSELARLMKNHELDAFLEDVKLNQP